MKISDVLQRALDELERVDFEFVIDETEAKEKRIDGRMVHHIKDASKSTH